MRIRSTPVIVAISLFALAATACDDDATGPEPPVPTAIEVEPTTATLTAIGEVVRLSATVLDQNGEPMPDVPVTWESLAGSVARVTGAGAVAAVAPGTATIEARTGSLGELATVTVAPAPTSVTIEPGVDTLNAIGDTATLTASVQDANGVAIEDATVSWASTDTTVATVDGAGRVVAVAPGTATISATAGETSVEADIVARQVAAAVTVTPAAPVLAEGASASLSALVVDSNGIQIAGADIAWSAEDTATATVDGAGLASGVFQGTTAITAESGGVAGEAVVRVLGRISYTTLTNTGGSSVRETFVMNADGTGVEKLDFLLDTDRAVAWSPDRSRIAFLSERSGDRDIWIANADGSGTPMNLTNDAAFDGEPDWSPDGLRVAYRSSTAGQADIWIRNADGSGTPFNVTDDIWENRHPAWSPDGLTIAFVERKPDTASLAIHVENTDGSLTTAPPITDPDSPYDDEYPAWSPDGRRIAFTGGPSGETDVYVVDVDGTNLRRLTHTLAGEWSPSWSWDGRRIVFVSFRDGNAELYMVDVETGEETRITNSLEHELTPRFLPRP